MRDSPGSGRRPPPAGYPAEGTLSTAGLAAFTPTIFPVGVVAGVTGRPWSFATGPATTADQAEHARTRLASALGVTRTSLFFPSQVHGYRVVHVPPSDSGPADGLITRLPGVYLCLQIADCCAVLVHDRARQAVGAFHAGWRGARDRIVARGLEAMARAWGTQAQDLLVYLSPCASGERYEVGPEVAAHFPRSIRTHRDGRTSLDLAAEMRRQLGDLGVPRDSIEDSGVCTMASSQCHSHRRDGLSAGRMAVYIGLVPAPPTRPARVTRPSG